MEEDNASTRPWCCRGLDVGYRLETYEQGRYCTTLGSQNRALAPGSKALMANRITRTLLGMFNTTMGPLSSLDSQQQLQKHELKGGRYSAVVEATIRFQEMLVALESLMCTSGRYCWEDLREENYELCRLASSASSVSSVMELDPVNPIKMKDAEWCIAAQVLQLVLVQKQLQMKLYGWSPKPGLLKIVLALNQVT